MKKTVQLSFEFPKSEYPYLKLICAELGISFKQLTINALLKKIEDYEDKKLAQKARKRLKYMNHKDNISFEKASAEVV
ncbi:MAG: hypothetical protein KDK63_00395 [Chlamydiia bacterium]|nr:hypothetical protein [Chlamydiia bacterium]